MKIIRTPTFFQKNFKSIFNASLKSFVLLSRVFIHAKGNCNVFYLFFKVIVKIKNLIEIECHLLN